jgi:lipoprotein-releasing system permease protein
MLAHPDITIARVKKAFPEVSAMAPYVAKEAMLKSENGIEGVFLKGIDAQNDISPVQTSLVEGENLLTIREGIPNLIVGKRLAEKLQIKLGQSVLIFTPGTTGQSLLQTRIVRFKVCGFFETGMGEYDESYVFSNLEMAQRLCQSGQMVSGFDIRVNNTEDIVRLGNEIPAMLGYPYYARTMYQTYRNLFTWVELQRKPIPIILGLIIIVATINIIGTLLMIVLEKSKDIGILRTLGADRGTIQKIFLFQGMLIGLVGTILGNAIALGICYIEMRYRFFSLPSNIYYMAHVPIELHLANFVLVSGIALLMCFITSWFPSRVAAALDPLITLRFR